LGEGWGELIYKGGGFWGGLNDGVVGYIWVLGRVGRVFGKFEKKSF